MIKLIKVLECWTRRHCIGRLKQRGRWLRICFKKLMSTFGRWRRITWTLIRLGKSVWLSSSWEFREIVGISYWRMLTRSLSSIRINWSSRLNSKNSPATHHALKKPYKKTTPSKCKTTIIIPTNAVSSPTSITKLQNPTCTNPKFICKWATTIYKSNANSCKTAANSSPMPMKECRT